MNKKLALLFVCIISISVAKAQDKIYLRAKKGFINAKITELGLDEVKYKEINNLEGPQFTLEKDDIEKIIYANGRLETFERSMAASVSIKEMHKNNLKFAFLAPMNDHLHFTFERALKRGQSWEAHASFIGLGMHHSNYTSTTYDSLGNGTTVDYFPKRAGLMLGAGYKLIFTPDNVMRGMRTRHIMQGSYVRPSFYIGDFAYNTYNTNNGYLNTKRVNVFAGALMAEFGKEWIFDNRISLDMHIGFGYGFDDMNRKSIDYISLDSYSQFYYMFQRLSLNTTSNSFFAMSGGIKMGYLFHTKKEKALSLEKETIK